MQPTFPLAAVLVAALASTAVVGGPAGRDATPDPTPTSAIVTKVAAPVPLADGRPAGVGVAGAPAPADRAADTAAATAPAPSPAPSPAAASAPAPTPAAASAPAPAAGVAAPGEVAPRAHFGWPLAPRPQVLHRFDRPQHPWSPGHRGVDLAAAVGQPVVSAGDGVVAYSGVVAGRGVVAVAHSGGLRTTYEPIDERPPVGTVVRRGSTIGVVAATPGHCAPVTCLHWGAISGATYRDPLSLLGFDHPVLLPLR